MPCRPACLIRIATEGYPMTRPKLPLALILFLALQSIAGAGEERGPTPFCPAVAGFLAPSTNFGVVREYRTVHRVLVRSELNFCPWSPSRSISSASWLARDLRVS